MDELQLLREFVDGVRPWDRVAAFDLIAQRLVDIPQGATMRALDDIRGVARGSSAHEVVASLFSGTGSTPPSLRGDGESYDEPGNSFIHSVVLRGKGIPLTLAVITSEVAASLDVDLEVVGMPGHVLVRDGRDPQRFFDLFGGGTELDENDCRELYRNLTALNDWDPRFLEPIDTAQQVFRMLNNLKSIYRRRTDTPRLRSVMAMRALFPGVAAAERGEFARLMRETN